MANGRSRLINLQPIIAVLGISLCGLAVFMLLPTLIDFSYNSGEWRTFAASLLLALFVGGAMLLSAWSATLEIHNREAFLGLVFFFTVLPFFGGLPFAFASSDFSLLDAYFEAVLAFTTTGGSLLSRLESLSLGLIFWRALLQWMGSVAVIFIALNTLPWLNVGGMQMFRSEATAPTDKPLWSWFLLLFFIGIIQGGFTLTFWALLFFWGDLGIFHSLLHAMATISGGSFAPFGSPILHGGSGRASELILAVGMLIGGMSFLIWIEIIRGHFRTAFKGSQLKWYLAITLGSTLLMALWLYYNFDFKLGKALRQSLFHVTSMLSGTGLTLAEAKSWGDFPLTLLFFLMFVGGCAGSTSGGLKIFRIEILFANARHQLTKLLRPHAVCVVNCNSRPVAEEDAGVVMSFLFIFVVVYALTAMAFALAGLDFLPSLLLAASSITNTGPGLAQEIGLAPSELSDALKWISIVAMLVGRLELFGFLVIFSHRLWKG